MKIARSSSPATVLIRTPYRRSKNAFCIPITSQCPNRIEHLFERHENAEVRQNQGRESEVAGTVLAMKRTLAALAALPMLTLAACGDDEKPKADKTVTVSATPTPSATEEAATSSEDQGLGNAEACALLRPELVSMRKVFLPGAGSTLDPNDLEASMTAKDEITVLGKRMVDKESELFGQLVLLVSSYDLMMEDPIQDNIDAGALALVNTQTHCDIAEAQTP